MSLAFEDRELGEKKGRFAREHICNNFSVERVGEKMAERLGKIREDLKLKRFREAMRNLDSKHIHVPD